MRFFWLIFAVAMLSYGAIIIARNSNNIIKNLKEDKLGVYLKFYGWALIAAVLGIYIIVKYIGQL